MIEQFPAEQTSVLSAAPKKRTTWPLLVGAPLLALAMAAPVWNSAAAVADVAATPTFAFASPAREQVTSSQRNAIQSAQDYLEISAFSRSGLIEQLEYEGYSTEDATFAVDSLNTDWNEQAARSAKQYLELSSFSRTGLIEQLEYEGFTREQAVYGVDAAY
ncbi:Ltp family lipoprotein [Nocardia sp. AG03]|uniref:Ltp family lipoprotein n=1 Tax=Nocardia sp. AG03 TaxID=3025312 RepID=UPI0024182366|nr:Ltp family lipoprotein [Nocardia sp. AG03]